MMVVVDSVSKQSHFIPTHTMVTALGSAQLYLQNIWKLHGLPQSALSNRGPQFVTEFMCELYRLLGITISAFTAYHPQSDRQTERVNQELKQYIHVFVNERQSDWDTLLPLGKFAYNNPYTLRHNILLSSSTLAETREWGSNLINIPPNLKLSMNSSIG
jgi:hypothetical protein